MESLQQVHYTDALLEIFFNEPVRDPITPLVEAMQNSTNGKIFPIRESLSVMSATGTLIAFIPHVPLKLAALIS